MGTVPGGAFAALVGSTAAGTFLDDYGSDSTASYTMSADSRTTVTSTFTVGGGTLNYARTGQEGATSANYFNSTSLLVNSSVFALNPTAFPTQTISADFTPRYTGNTSGNDGTGRTFYTLLLGAAGGKGFGIRYNSNTNITTPSADHRFDFVQFNGGSSSYLTSDPLAASTVAIPLTTGTAQDVGSLPSGTSYHVSVIADRSASDATFTISITTAANGGEAFALTTTPTGITGGSSAFGGLQIGYVARTNGNPAANALTAFDNLSVAVPEPASLALLAGGAALGLRRRRV